MGIVWSKELETGVKVIDEQHQFIIESLSDVETSNLEKPELFELLTKLQAYLSVHFEVEEDYMVDTDYPGYEQHKAIHDKVLEDCQDILTQNYNNNDPSKVAHKLVGYMKTWFSDHYANEDVKMADFLKENQWKIN